ncbi:MAG: hypothetical protein ACR2OB_14875 [Solirubrobacteraceae bacterium]
MDEEALSGAGETSGDGLRDLESRLDVDELRELVAWAAEWHLDVERRLRLTAARSSGDLRVLRGEVDRGLRTRKFLGYRESVAWAREARPIVDELERAVESSPSRELVALLERAVGHVVKVIQARADDSSGMVGDLARDLLEVHARACEAGVADPVKLANWMIRFRFVDQDFFEPDPVRYRDALGETGLAAYRAAVEAHSDQDAFAVRYARERLAILDRDRERIVELLGGDLSAAHQFLAVAEAMVELDLPEEALAWATRGIAQTRGWQTDRLYDLACAVHTNAGRHVEVLAIRRAQHERSPTAGSYSQLRRAAEAVDAWALERDAAILALRERNLRGLVDALLDDGDADAAWVAALALAPDELGDPTWLRLAEAREATHPAEAIPIYLRIADEVLLTADRRSYTQATRILKRARAAAAAAGHADQFAETLATLREQHRRRPSLIAMLDKAGLTGHGAA